MASEDGRPGLHIKVRGTVQGVGFRPYVYGLAAGMGLRGRVSNSSDGVLIEVEGENAPEFLDRLPREAPPLARITQVDVSPLPPRGYAEFRIVESADTGGFTLISPDAATCPDCLRELFDPTGRRYRYPFINCTNCGPRYSITRRVPYDRPNTTMAAFALCPDCEREYRDPHDRRFHAEPNACPRCGPTVAGHGPGFEGGEGGGGPISRAVDLLRGGAIVAVKGLGGFHLACDALNAEAVARLRERKRRSNKPFALMARGMDTVKKFCEVSADEEALLASTRRPVVLLRRKAPCPLPEAVAPGMGRLGLMLPYTPLHHLLFDGLDALVMTSGNLSEEPIQVANNEAARKLSGMADAFLTHDRDIFMRVDDSVMKLTPLGPAFIRRARGYTPEPIALLEDGPDVLATGADIKCAFTLMKGGHAIVSQHIGDMENQETLDFFEEALENLKAVYRAEPVALAHDLHPGYLSTRWAEGQPIKRLGVQHHHAHIASVMAEHGLTGRVIGLAMDGTGYGLDGALWGGEFLLADPVGFKRAGRLKYVPLPGGEAAVREPWRTAVSYICAAFGGGADEALKEIGFHDRYGQDRLKDVVKVMGLPEFSPRSSGLGRLFDAVSAVLGVCDGNTFEGEAAMALEALAAGAGETEEAYPVDISSSTPMEVDFSYAVLYIVNDMKRGVGVDAIAARFHNTVIDALHRVAERLSGITGIRDVALSGGAFQNDLLLSGLARRLAFSGLNVYTNHAAPSNDGGISLGQAYILRESLKRGLVR